MDPRNCWKRWMHVLGVVCGLGMAGLCQPGMGADWPQFRGPNRTDVSQEKNLLPAWPADGPAVAWSAKGYGEGFSSVSIVGEQIFSMGDIGDSSYLLAANRGDGKVTWKTKVGQPGGNYKGTRCTPTVNGGRVYGLGQFGDFVCCEAATGKELWRKSFKQEFGGRHGAWEFTESPLVDGNVVVVTPGGPEAAMVALNKESGAVVWKGVIPGGDVAGYSSIVITEAGGVRQYVQLMANGLVSFAAKDGKLLWRYGNTNERFGGNTANIPTPIVQGDHLFASAGYGRGGGLLKVSGNGSEVSVSEVYFNRDIQNRHGGVVLVGDYIYGDRDDSGFPWCADWKTGKIRWKKDKRTAGGGSAAVTYADGRLYFQYDNGVVALVDPAADTYTEVSTFKIPNARPPCWSHPVILDGKLYVRNQDELWCYDIAKK
jgi:outer membrane protein assembly factor BamB